jgi:hypothetical protein
MVALVKKPSSAESRKNAAGFHGLGAFFFDHVAERAQESKAVDA